MSRDRGVMTREELLRTLKEGLEVKKEIVALKAVQEPHRGIPPCKDRAIPGMCALLGEIRRKARPGM